MMMSMRGNTVCSVYMLFVMLAALVIPIRGRCLLSIYSGEQTLPQSKEPINP